MASGRNEKENEAFNYFSKLANYRKTSTALSTGKLMQYIPQDDVYVYFRYTEDNAKTVMVILNSADKARDLKTARFAERMEKASSATNIITGEKINDLSKLAVPARTCLVLELN